ncbi:hypothetical protein Tco_1230258 [Tanacetum coccineum]
MNKKNYSFDLETFRDMLQICPNYPGQKFVDPPFEEEILAFIRELGYSGNVKSLSDVKVETLTQPWRTFGTIINNVLVVKLSLSNREQGVKEEQRHVLSKIHQSYYQPLHVRRSINSKKKQVRCILPDTLTNQAMKESEAYKTYHDFATGKVVPKPKYVRRLTREKTDQAPKASPGKRLKATAKVATSGKKKLSAQGLDTLLEITLSEAEQMKIITKRSKTKFHSSYASGSGADEGTGVSSGVPDVPTYGSKDEQISWKSSDDDGDDDEVSESKDDDDNVDNEDNDGQDDDNEQTESDNDDEDFVHPKFSTHDEKERQEEEDKEEEGSDLRVHIPSHFESTDDETYNDVTQRDNVEGEELDEEETNEEEEVNELYRDVKVNLERRDVEIIDALQTNVQGTQVIEDTRVIITAVTPEVQ